MTPAHGGLWGAVAEVGAVFLALILVGFFLWRSKKKEEELEEVNRTDGSGE